MTPDETRMTVSDPMGRLVLQGMEEVMGRSGVNAVLNTAGLAHLMRFFEASRQGPAAGTQPVSFGELSGIQGTLEKLYGPRGGAGLALRTGRAMFTDLLRQSGQALGLTDLNYRLLPVHSKLQVGLDALAGYFSRETSAAIHVEEEEQRYVMYIERCPLCHRRAQGDFVCHMLVGVLQEFLYWASGGKYFEVTEGGCSTRHENGCIIAIGKQTFE